MQISADSFELILSEIGEDNLAIPYLSQWMGIWCIESLAVEALFDKVKNLDIPAHLAFRPEKSEYPKVLSSKNGKAVQRSDQRVDRDGIATISLNGPMQKHQSSFSSASTVVARRDIRSAANEDAIGAILLAIESPGGTAAGTYELANEIIRARSSKPIFAHITDIGASAAYWVASQADRVTANQPAQIGSIGTYAVVTDSSTAAAQMGYKVHVIKAGEFKGTGTPGTEVTESQLKHLQERVTAVNGNFLNAVQVGRKMTFEQMMELADGRTFSTTTAKDKNLIDGIATFDEAFAQAKEHVKTKKPQVKGTRMSESTTAIAASVQAIEQACAGASADFILSCVRAEASVETAVSRYVVELSSVNASLNKTIAEQKAQIEALTAERDGISVKLAAASVIPAEPTKSANHPGVQPLKSSTTEPAVTSASEQYWSEVNKLCADGKSRAQAMKHVNTFNAPLRMAMTAEANRR